MRRKSNLRPIDLACPRRLALPAVLLATICLVYGSDANADNECGVGTVIVCNNSGQPDTNTNPYQNGIIYTGQNINLTLASGVVVDTSTGNPELSPDAGTVGVGFGFSTGGTAGDASLTVQPGVSITIAQPDILGLVIRGTVASTNSTATIVNDGTILMASTGGRGIYAFTNGDENITNNGTVTGAAAYGIYAQDAGADHTLTITNTGTIDVSDAAFSTGIHGSEEGDLGIVTILQSGTVKGASYGINFSSDDETSQSRLNNSGLIQGGTAGLYISGSNFLVTNTGTIASPTGTGVSSTGGIGSLVNAEGGLISGTVGINRNASNGTITNAGTITGTGGTAIALSGNDNVLALESGSVINGNVVSTGTGNGLQLFGQGSNTGNFTGFSTAIMRGSNWLLGGLTTTAGALDAANIQSGVLTITGLLGDLGGATIAPGATLQIGNGGATGNLSGNVVDNGVLVFDTAGTVSYTDAISGTGSLVQRGPGLLQLQGDQTYSGPTSVLGGTLAVNGSIQSNTTSVLQGATLSGFGNLYADVLNQGTVWPGNAVVGDTQYGTLTVHGNYVGQGGLLTLNTFLGRDGSPSDLLVIDGGSASGSTGVVIHNTAPGPRSLGMFGGNGILVVSAIDGATTTPSAFALTSEVRNGAYEYRLLRGAEDGSSPESWYLRDFFTVEPVEPEPPEPPDPVLPPDPPPDPLPPGEYPIIGPEVATYNVVQPIARQLGLLTLGTLNQRVGDGMLVAAGPGDADPGPSGWARVFASHVDNTYLAYAKPSANGYLTGMQAGVDVWQGELIPGHSDRFGGYLAYGNADIDVRGLVTNEDATAYVLQHTGTLTLHQTSAGTYWTHVGPSGWYLDGVFQASTYNGNASTANARLDTHGTGFVASLEAGDPIALPQWGSGFVLEPQVQAIWQRVRFSDGNDSLGDVALGGTHGSTGRLGVRGKWHIAGESGRWWEPYAALNLWRDWGGRASTVFDQETSAQLVPQATRLEFAGGITGKLSARLSVYGYAGYQTAVGDTRYARRETFNGNVGLRYTW